MAEQVSENFRTALSCRCTALFVLHCGCERLCSLLCCMSFILSLQIERAFQKQKGVSQAKAGLLSTKKKDGVVRYYKSIGLGFRTPKEAIEGSYVDKKCPFTSNVSIRGRILKGQLTLKGKDERNGCTRDVQRHVAAQFQTGNFSD
jgi:hypothetical protein